MISKEIAYLSDFKEKADKLRASFGKTGLFFTGSKGLDEYLGGGFGRPNGYEIVLLFGPTGIGKTTVALNMLLHTIKSNKKVGLLMLEDDMADIYLKLESLLGEKNIKALQTNTNIQVLPEKALSASWRLDELLQYIEDWFTLFDNEVILLDHLQFAFEGAESVRGENEYIAQRVFMQKLNHLMKKVKKTIILINHTNRSKGKGLDRVIGSSAIAQASTKAIEIERDGDDFTLTMHKSRFTPTPSKPFSMELKSNRLVGTWDDIPQ